MTTSDLTAAHVERLLKEHGVTPLAVELCADTGYGGAPRPVGIVVRFSTLSEVLAFDALLKGIRVTIAQGERGLYTAVLSLRGAQ